MHGGEAKERDATTTVGETERGALNEDGGRGSDFIITLTVD
jgi:hypothetical protein